MAGWPLKILYLQNNTKPIQMNCFSIHTFRKEEVVQCIVFIFNLNGHINASVRNIKGTMPFILGYDVKITDLQDEYWRTPIEIFLKIMESVCTIAAICRKTKLMSFFTLRGWASNILGVRVTHQSYCVIKHTHLFEWLIHFHISPLPIKAVIRPNNSNDVIMPTNTLYTTMPWLTL